MKYLKEVLLLVSLLYLSLYISLAFMIYSPLWYDFNYGLDETYDRVNNELLEDATYNLIFYYFHQKNLNENFWSEEEQIHYKEVRDIYDVLFILAIISILLLYFLWDFKEILKLSYINSFLPLFLLLIVPISLNFMDGFLHPFLFNNDFWIMYPNELSFHLFDHSFFVRSLIVLVIFSSLSNYILHKKLSSST